MTVITGQRVLVETFSDDVWGTVTAVYFNGFNFQGDNWSMPLFFTFHISLALNIVGCNGTCNSTMVPS